MSVVSFHEVRLEVVRREAAQPAAIAADAVHGALWRRVAGDLSHPVRASPVDDAGTAALHNAWHGGTGRGPRAHASAELAQLGEDIARILDDLPTLSTALARAKGRAWSTPWAPPAISSTFA
jgi:hypothetical protein